jgi:hypothetical protein
MKTDDGYNEERARAQKLANETGFDVGIWKNALGWTVQILPRVENRYGTELRCEVVHPDRLDTVRPGHGPEATYQGRLRGSW